MPETTNIARMAEILSDDVFSRFLWSRTGPLNQNWPCETEAHAPRTSHPSDVVFYYDEPYTLRRTYVNCDLKSYAKASISASAVLAALENLAQSLSCIEISSEWRNMYIHDGCTPSICGLLFIYNHDGDYDSDFDKILAQVKHEKIRVPRGSQIALFGPQQIRWLDNVRYEIIHMRGISELPPEAQCRFQYPHQVRKKKVQVEKARAASLEMLAGPWITLAYDSYDGRRPGIVVFYGQSGESTEEFLYLIDYLMHYQMVKPGVDIRIRTLEPDGNSAAHFERAIDEYRDNFQGGDEIAGLLSSIDYRQLHQVHRSFSQVEIGMNNV